jgi:hypothetical protein
MQGYSKPGMAAHLRAKAEQELKRGNMRFTIVQGRPAVVDLVSGDVRFQDEPVSTRRDEQGREFEMPRSQRGATPSYPAAPPGYVNRTDAQGNIVGQAALPGSTAAAAETEAQRKAALEAEANARANRADARAETAAGSASRASEFGNANTLRDEFTTQTKDFRIVQDMHRKMIAASKANSGAGDMAMLYGMAKLLDPNSVVRESEFATMAAAGSFGERMQGMVSRVLTGERLPDSLRQEFVDQANSIFSEQKKGYDQLQKTYASLAKKFGLDPELIIPDFVTPGEADGKRSGGDNSTTGARPSPANLLGLPPGWNK